MPTESPHFVRPGEMSTSPYERPIGSSIRLQCQASGEPLPNIVWYRNGNMIQQEQNLDAESQGEDQFLDYADYGEEHDEESRSRWTLRLAHLTEADKGRYTCRVYNTLGSINFTYTLDVVGTQLIPMFDCSLGECLRDCQKRNRPIYFGTFFCTRWKCLGLDTSLPPFDLKLKSKRSSKTLPLMHCTLNRSSFDKYLGWFLRFNFSESDSKSFAAALTSTPILHAQMFLKFHKIWELETALVKFPMELLLRRK